MCIHWKRFGQIAEQVLREFRNIIEHSESLSGAYIISFVMNSSCWDWWKMRWSLFNWTAKSERMSRFRELAIVWGLAMSWIKIVCRMWDNFLHLAIFSHSNKSHSIRGFRDAKTSKTCLSRHSHVRFIYLSNDNHIYSMTYLLVPINVRPSENPILPRIVIRKNNNRNRTYFFRHGAEHSRWKILLILHISEVIHSTEHLIGLSRTGYVGDKLILSCIVRDKIIRKMFVCLVISCGLWTPDR